MAVANPTIKNVTYQDANNAPITRQVAEASGTVASVPDAPTVVSGTELDVGGLWSFGFTFICTVFNITLSIYGANSPDFTDEVVLVSAAAMTAGNNYMWTGGTGLSAGSVSNFPYRYVRVKADNAVNGSVATLAWFFFGKNT